jgi:MoxR-like ATPase
VEDVNALREAVQELYIDPALRRWAIRLVRATRDADGVAIGASVRGSLALERAARAWALLDGRDYVTPVDVELLFLPVLMHRIVFTPSFVAGARELGWQRAAVHFLEQCLERAPRPGAELEAVSAA